MSNYPITHEQIQPKELLSIIIAFYNEEESIGPLRERLRVVIDRLSPQWGIQFVLVDDGSTDATYEHLVDAFGCVDTPGVTILRHMTNQGLGAALRTGFDAAKGHYVCTLDADCTYPPEEIIRMLDVLIDSKADLVTASPYHPDGNVQFKNDWRIMLSRTANWIYSVILPAKLYCYTSMFRVYRRPWANSQFFKSNDFLAVTEILVEAAIRGAKIVECPMELGKRTTGTSKMRVARTMAHHFYLMTGTAMRRLRSHLFQHRLFPRRP